jgi:hypothetical protein
VTADEGRRIPRPAVVPTDAFGVWNAIIDPALDAFVAAHVDDIWEPA